MAMSCSFGTDAATSSASHKEDPMKRMRIAQLVACSVVTAAVGCGGNERPARSTTETTSTVVRTITPELSAAQETAARLERERDEAREQAAMDKARREREVETLRERSDFEAKIRKQLDATDEELEALKVKAERFGPAMRSRIEHLSMRREDIEQLLRRAHEESAVGWERLKADVNAAVEELKKEVGTQSGPGRTRSAPPPRGAPTTSPASKQP
jgi:septal ring factor EnvC (AmiA/AmiB activator)